MSSKLIAILLFVPIVLFGHVKCDGVKKTKGKTFVNKEDIAPLIDGILNSLRGEKEDRKYSDFQREVAVKLFQALKAKRNENLNGEEEEKLVEERILTILRNVPKFDNGIGHIFMRIQVKMAKRELEKIHKNGELRQKIREEVVRKLRQEWPGYRHSEDSLKALNALIDLECRDGKAKPIFPIEEGEVRRVHVIIALGDVLNGFRGDKTERNYAEFLQEIAKKLLGTIKMSEEGSEGEILKIEKMIKNDPNIEGRIRKTLHWPSRENCKNKFGNDREIADLTKRLESEWKLPRNAFSDHLLKCLNFAIQREFHAKLYIAQVSLPYASTPPKSYAGIERIASYLTEELVRRGHHVTLFASSDSVTEAKKLISTGPSINSIAFPHNDDFLAYAGRVAKWLMKEVRQSAHQFDVIHFHTHFLFDKMCAIVKLFRESPAVMTVHNLLSRYPMLCKEFSAIPLISISEDQQKHTGFEPHEKHIYRPNFIGTVHNGIPRDLYKFMAGGKYLAFLGRFVDFKRAEWAIEIAVQANVPLKIAAKMPREDTEEYKYFEEKVKPLLEKYKGGGQVEYWGEIEEGRKNDFLGNALALLFPLGWPEPFGMVMIEAMACGTPVLTQRIGATEEVVEEGISGLFFESIEEGVEKVGEVARLDRAGVRNAFEARFTVEHMADGYEQIFYDIADKKKP